MAADFHSIHYNVVDQSDDEPGARPALRGLRSGAQNARTGTDFTNVEAAARFYLNRVFGRDPRAAVRGLSAADEPTVVPDMKLRDSVRSGLTNTWIVRFSQTASSIPVFGSHVVVELDRNRELLTIDGQLAEIRDISPFASRSPAEALGSIGALAGADPATFRDATPPELVFFHDVEDGRDAWHLAYYFKSIPAAPPGAVAGMKTHGIGRSIAQHHPQHDYLVDAHEGTVLRYWSSIPTIEIPAECVGVDEDGVEQTFYGRENDVTKSYEMSDPMRQILTCDMALNDMENTVAPAGAVAAATNQFPNSAAVSAHVYATRVYDFYRSVLLRNGIDDKGMQLISYVNCTYPSLEAPPQWRNAVWYKQRMWYGQDSGAGGTLKSYARYLDVIAHELTHGVTEFTAALIYWSESGALNESFSDIFAIIVKNWDRTAPGNSGGDVSTWNWEIGSDCHGPGRPIRDVSDPTRTGDPDHMTNYVRGAADNGGVHTNSNIHNKAAHNVLTITDSAGKPVFTPREVALLYYLCLTRLFKVSSFVQARDTLMNVTRSYFSGSSTREEKVAAIRTAYAAVGI
ncbi:MAG: M4 family metallopeptidase [Candidatus Eremiobacteraeota bacterium]|nr:M4 family metallopeptidase [Candidatus Eremiobacteraeota bacterium]